MARGGKGAGRAIKRRGSRAASPISPASAMCGGDSPLPCLLNSLRCASSAIYCRYKHKGNIVAVCAPTPSRLAVHRKFICFFHLLERQLFRISRWSPACCAFSPTCSFCRITSNDHSITCAQMASSLVGATLNILRKKQR